MTRSGFRPACASAGANRSGRVMHHKTLPRVRAATPAANSAAAAPSMAPLPPPEISCSAPSANPPPGSRASRSAIPKGSTDLAGRRRPSIFSIRARKSSMAGSCRKMVVDLHERVYEHVLHLFYDWAVGVKWGRAGRSVCIRAAACEMTCSFHATQTAAMRLISAIRGAIGSRQMRT